MLAQIHPQVSFSHMTTCFVSIPYTSLTTTSTSNCKSFPDGFLTSFVPRSLDVLLGPTCRREPKYQRFRSSPWSDNRNKTIRRVKVQRIADERNRCKWNMTVNMSKESPETPKLSSSVIGDQSPYSKYIQEEDVQKLYVWDDKDEDSDYDSDDDSDDDDDDESDDDDDDDDVDNDNVDNDDVDDDDFDIEEEEEKEDFGYVDDDIDEYNFDDHSEDFDEEYVNDSAVNSDSMGNSSTRSQLDHLSQPRPLENDIQYEVNSDDFSMYSSAQIKQDIQLRRERLKQALKNTFQGNIDNDTVQDEDDPFVARQLEKLGAITDDSGPWIRPKWAPCTLMDPGIDEFWDQGIEYDVKMTLQKKKMLAYLVRRKGGLLGGVRASDNSVFHMARQMKNKYPSRVNTLCLAMGNILASRAKQSGIKVVSLKRVSCTISSWYTPRVADVLRGMAKKKLEIRFNLDVYQRSQLLGKKKRGRILRSVWAMAQEGVKIYGLTRADFQILEIYANTWKLQLENFDALDSANKLPIRTISEANDPFLHEIWENQNTDHIFNSFVVRNSHDAQDIDDLSMEKFLPYQFPLCQKLKNARLSPKQVTNQSNLGIETYEQDFQSVANHGTNDIDANTLHHQHSEVNDKNYRVDTSEIPEIEFEKYDDVEKDIADMDPAHEETTVSVTKPKLSDFDENLTHISHDELEDVDEYEESLGGSNSDHVISASAQNTMSANDIDSKMKNSMQFSSGIFSESPSYSYLDNLDKVPKENQSNFIISEGLPRQPESLMPDPLFEQPKDPNEKPKLKLPIIYYPSTAPNYVDQSVDIEKAKTKVMHTPVVHFGRDRTSWRAGLDYYIKPVILSTRIYCYIVKNDGGVLAQVDTESPELQKLIETYYSCMGYDGYLYVTGYVIAERALALGIKEVFWDVATIRSQGDYHQVLAILLGSASVAGLKIRANVNEYVRKMRIKPKNRKLCLPAFLNMISNGIDVWEMNTDDFDYLTKKQEAGTKSISVPMQDFQSMVRRHVIRMPVIRPTATELRPYLKVVIMREHFWAYVGVDARENLGRNASGLITWIRSHEVGMEQMLEYMSKRDYPAACAAGAGLAIRCKANGIDFLRLSTVTIKKKGNHYDKLVAFCRTLMEQGIELDIDLPAFWKKHKIKKLHRHNFTGYFMRLADMGANVNGIDENDVKKIIRITKENAEREKKAARLQRRKIIAQQKKSAIAAAKGTALGPILEYDEKNTVQKLLGSSLGMIDSLNEETALGSIIPRIDSSIDFYADQTATRQDDAIPPIPLSPPNMPAPQLDPIGWRRDLNTFVRFIYSNQRMWGYVIREGEGLVAQVSSHDPGLIDEMKILRQTDAEAKSAIGPRPQVVGKHLAKLALESGIDTVYLKGFKSKNKVGVHERVMACLGHLSLNGLKVRFHIGEFLQLQGFGQRTRVRFLPYFLKMEKRGVQVVGWEPNDFLEMENLKKLSEMKKARAQSQRIEDEQTRRRKLTEIRAEQDQELRNALLDQADRRTTNMPKGYFSGNWNSDQDRRLPVTPPIKITSYNEGKQVQDDGLPSKLTQNLRHPRELVMTPFGPKVKKPFDLFELRQKRLKAIKQEMKEEEERVKALAKSDAWSSFAEESRRLRRKILDLSPGQSVTSSIAEIEKNPEMKVFALQTPAKVEKLSVKNEKSPIYGREHQSSSIRVDSSATKDVYILWDLENKRCTIDKGQIESLTALLHFGTFYGNIREARVFGSRYEIEFDGNSQLFFDELEKKKQRLRSELRMYGAIKVSRYRCSICDTNFFSRVSLRRHEVSIHGIQNSSEEGKEMRRSVYSFDLFGRGTEDEIMRRLQERGIFGKKQSTPYSQTVEAILRRLETLAREISSNSVLIIVSENNALTKALRHFASDENVSLVVVHEDTKSPLLKYADESHDWFNVQADFALGLREKILQDWDVPRDEDYDDEIFKDINEMEGSMEDAEQMEYGEHHRKPKVRIL